MLNERRACWLVDDSLEDGGNTTMVINNWQPAEAARLVVGPMWLLAFSIVVVKPLMLPWLITFVVVLLELLLLRLVDPIVVAFPVLQLDHNGDELYDDNHLPFLPLPSFLGISTVMNECWWLFACFDGSTSWCFWSVIWSQTLAPSCLNGQHMTALAFLRYVWLV